MKRHISTTLTIVLISFLGSVNAQSIWTKSSLSSFRDAPEEDKMILPEHYEAYQLAFDDLKKNLEGTPTEEDKKKGISGTIVSLPMPNGKFESFEVFDAPVMAPKLAAKYPSIKSYKGRSLDTPGMNVRFDTGPYGLHAAIHGTSKVVYIDPYIRGNTNDYLTYDVKDHLSQMDITTPICGVHDQKIRSFGKHRKVQKRNSEPVPLKVYRFALACTGEWGSIRGSVENALADMNTGLNRINQIFENELAIRLVLIDNNDLLIHLDGPSDPYLVVNEGLAMLNANTGIVNQRVGLDAYDIGHVYHTSCDVGGVASLGSMCRNGTKAAAVTCHYSFNLNFMAASVTAHELGHQMTAQHTFNNCTGDGNETLSNAFEPGSGSTIMSYGGLCGSNNVVGNGQGGDYYHVASLIQIYNHTRDGLAGEGCAEFIETDNVEPTVTILHENDFYIPEDTYFFLEGKGEDENAEDELTYAWEQMNKGNPLDGLSPLGSPIGDAPHFRSLPPTTSPVRYFPSPDNIIAGNFDRTEVAFKGNRTVNFMLTVRDNNAEAGTAVWDEVQFNVVETPVKFGITSQNSSEVYEVGDQIDVTWNVAETYNFPVNAKFVDILLFTGNFSNFSLENTTMLAERVANNGSAKVYLPDVTTNNGRIIIRASESIFFSINSTNIRIESSTSPKLIVNSDPLAQLQCDASDVFTYEFNSLGIAGTEGSVTYTILDGLPDGATATFEPETADIGAPVTLTIDPEADPVGKEYVITVGAITESMDTFTRSIDLILLSTDHSDVDAISPEKNAFGLSSSNNIQFSWSASPNAEFYRFEFSESPEFGETNIETVELLKDLTYEPNYFFAKNRVYYWKVTATNFCGDDLNAKTFAFSTESLSCTVVEPADGILPINISASGLPTIEAPIDVNIGGNVADVNIKRWAGEHENNRDMIVTLVSPEGKEVILVNRKCPQANFNCAFDDDSNVPVKCPLNNGSTYRPEQSLSNFNGDPLDGEWTLRIDDVSPGNGGRLELLEIEFCSNQVLDNPFLVNNEKLILPTESTETISSSQLRVDDDNNSDDELIYTIVDLPKTGALTFDGATVSAGDQFTQQDIDDNKLSFNSSTQITSTFFSFTVIDGEGGFIGITNFDVQITDPTSTKDERIQDDISIYPVPAQNLITFDLSKSNSSYSTFEILDLNGQLIKRNKLIDNEVMQVDISDITSGLYIVNFRSDKNIVTKKIVVQQ
ncbi:MAG: reprolysin-like metallopeptidase [Bacteroidota bacterium]